MKGICRTPVLGYFKVSEWGKHRKKRSLDDRFNARPELAKIVREITDEMGLCIEQGGGMDEAEKRKVRG